MTVRKEQERKKKKSAGNAGFSLRFRGVGVAGVGLRAECLLRASLFEDVKKSSQLRGIWPFYEKIIGRKIKRGQRVCPLNGPPPPWFRKKSLGRKAGVGE